MQPIGLSDVGFFGFSVTEQGIGYIRSLREIIKREAPGELISSFAMGAASGKIIPYIFNRIAANNVKVLLFEIATCIRFSDENPNGYSEILREIGALCQMEGFIPGFINLYRKGIDYDNDIWGDAIKEFSEKNSLPFLDLVPLMRDIELNGELEKYLRDGTHTTQLGADLYAERIFHFIKTLAPTNAEKGILNRSRLFGEFKKKQIFLGHCAENFEGFSRGGLSFNTLGINAGENVTIQLPHDFRLDGIMFLMGPRTGNLHVSINGQFFRKIMAYDHACYYDRISYKFFSSEGATSIDVFQCYELPIVALKKGEPDCSPRYGRFVGALLTEI